MVTRIGEHAQDLHPRANGFAATQEHIAEDLKAVAVCAELSHRAERGWHLSLERVGRPR
jgi:hypothetical protein